MLCTKQKVLRRFWYATVPVDRLDDGPKPFTLLGEKIVLFLGGDGKPAALADRCCHRTARLSKGWSQDGHIICGYHGWTYDRTGVPINNPPAAFRVTGTTEPTTKRHMRNAWFMPFCRTLDIEYPTGLRHIIFNSATPIDDGSIQLVQVLFRNDREEDCSTQELIDWDAAIIEEDREILESTDPDAIVDINRKIEMHMPSDRPGMLMRRRLLALLESHGETEVPR
jgi:phenylpropionate dioxygenase-like ring-hydroxylating dioxygenase large terminal subunit